MLQRKRKIVILLGFIACFANGACALKLISDRTIDWKFVQDAGGLSLGKPIKTDSGSWTLPVKCDISGLEKITVPPKTLNSALVVEQVLYRQEGPNLFIQLAVNVSDTSKTKSALCPAALLQGIPAGDYNVFYDEAKPIAIGNIRLP